MTAKLSFTKDEVLEAYGGDVSIRQAAKVLGCSVVPLTKLIREYGIPIKSKWRTGRKQSTIPQLNDRDWLYEQLVVKGRAQRDVAIEIGSTPGNVAHYARRHDLYPRSSQSEASQAWYRRKFPKGRRGPLSPRWKGGRRKTGSGYVQIYKPDHPNATAAGYVYEHRLVMEEKLGRLLVKGEVVDHIDCNKGNNAPENLRLHATRADHVKDHFRARLEINELRQRIAELEAENKQLRERK